MSFAQAWTNKTGGVSQGIENGRTLYSMINVAAPRGFHFPTLDKPIDFAPLQWNLTSWNIKMLKEKLKRKEDRAQRGYSEYGSLNYPCLVSLAGDLDVANPFSEHFGLFDRGWKWFCPQSSEEEK